MSFTNAAPNKIPATKPPRWAAIPIGGSFIRPLSTVNRRSTATPVSATTARRHNTRIEMFIERVRRMFAKRGQRGAPVSQRAEIFLQSAEIFLQKAGIFLQRAGIFLQRYGIFSKRDAIFAKREEIL